MYIYQLQKVYIKLLKTLNGWHKIRTNKWGGRLALIHNREYKVDTSNRENTDTYESCTWKITIGTSTLSTLGVYHPPDTYNYMFIDDFMDKVMVELSQHETMSYIPDSLTY